MRIRPGILCVASCAALSGAAFMTLWVWQDAPPDQGHQRRTSASQAPAREAKQSAAVEAVTGDSALATRPATAAQATPAGLPAGGEIAGRRARPERNPSLVPPAGAAADAWRAAIDERRAARNAVALQHLVEQLSLATPLAGGLTGGERYRLLTRAAFALGALGHAGRGALEDLCQSAHRDVRLAAMNAVFAIAGPAERERLVAAALSDPDGVVRAKG